MSILSKPVVLIFGAGATRGAYQDNTIPPPVDKDFFDIANQIRGRGTQLLVKKVLKSVWELYGRTSGISLEEYYRDIETRAIIGKFAKPANQPKNWEKRRTELEELIRRVYIHTTCKESQNHLNPIPSSYHKEIFKELTTGDIIVTFNYDLTIEESLEDVKLWNPIDGYGVNVSGKTLDWCRLWIKNRTATAPPKSKIKLLKLHGSLNWTLYKNQKIRLKSRPYVVRTRNNKEQYESVSILAPGWNKRIDRNPYKKFWREARRGLEKCKSILIIGYSLPDTDLLAKSLFAEIVRSRKAGERFFKELHIADPDFKTKEKLINIFTPAMGPYGKIFMYNGITEFVKPRTQ